MHHCFPNPIRVARKIPILILTYASSLPLLPIASSNCSTRTQDRLYRLSSRRRHRLFASLHCLASLLRFIAPLLCLYNQLPSSAILFSFRLSHSNATLPTLISLSLYSFLPLQPRARQPCYTLFFV
ncbi:hypothetical protein EDD21DRAFT_119300 [Dissophora ornata]|nr:hypothetical protein EDD21DRAFT_119300 [Dissophora ornata]